MSRTFMYKKYVILGSRKGILIGSCRFEYVLCKGIERIGFWNKEEVKRFINALEKKNG